MNAAQDKSTKHTPLIVPSGWHLMQQIKAAEAKFDAANTRAMNERAERAFAINRQILRDEREHDVRRHMHVGDCRAAIAKAGA